MTTSTNLEKYCSPTRRVKQRYVYLLQPLERHFKEKIKIAAIVYLPLRKYKKDFSSKRKGYALSILLTGQGKIRYKGKSYELKAPCVFQQFPGEEYIIEVGAEWEEVFLRIDKDKLPVLKKKGYFFKEPFSWQIGNSKNIFSILKQIFSMFSIFDNEVKRRFIADKIDLLCENVIFEAVTERFAKPLDKDEQLIRTIESEVCSGYLDDFNFDLVAERNNLSTSKFRKLWNKYIKEPPGHYILSLRLEEACRLLVETDETINTISEKTRFKDQYYFSKLFKKKFKVSPSKYRENWGCI